MHRINLGLGQAMLVHAPYPQWLVVPAIVPSAGTGSPWREEEGSGARRDGYSVFSAGYGRQWHLLDLEMAPPAGVEPTTYRLGGGRSIH